MVSAHIKEGPRFKNQSNDDQNDILQNNSQSYNPIQCLLN